ncbi:hypothetical protein BOSE62_40018 [Bosea sp. 62]|nr:hypothetical protein BOSE46_120771 [Bosea sp. 46]CAD5265258.1 hypothetical protein BOSE21B_111010 [Bosea sp. 21B]CAD5275087.1 hypothetical protein BOSE7B_40205 [Bosea sp. 7B]VXB72962.1 hypothetical protein BOSE29B_120082 [Bosea sp. 29B]VXC29123.1 hypothetical protein BOSE62_40018 [Bosea sp. 62]
MLRKIGKGMRRPNTAICSGKRQLPALVLCQIADTRSAQLSCPNQIGSHGQGGLVRGQLAKGSLDIAWCNGARRHPR